MCPERLCSTSREHTGRPCQLVSQVAQPGLTRHRGKPSWSEVRHLGLLKHNQGSEKPVKFLENGAKS